ncbi:uncharacterized protein LOC123561181 isoform X3 [Mercenaria mercenaria]|uniref:uncharacterized protein LOC123561181 isoform X3 n=1 Tax=Mercenaria mercenaria TaxID=6596 RepID=UPI00234E52A9|nr:uncharacterized protein LOC123561181 isoform X3 [Mercenaria mercenaria]
MDFAEWMVFALLVCISENMVVGKLTCLSCRGIPRTTDCGIIEKCGSHSNCYIDMVVTTAGAIYFDLGCRDTLQCGGSGRRRNAGRNVTSLPSPDVLGQKVLQVDTTTVKNNTSEYSVPTKQSHDTMLQRRASLTTCSSCCSYGNFCNDNGCGQTGFTHTRGPICYACQQQKDLDDCREIKICGRDEICYIEEINLANDKIYHTGCMSKIKCNDQNINMATSSAVMIGRDLDRAYLNENVLEVTHLDNRQERASNSGKGCCLDDLCNTFLPQNGNWGPWTSWSSCSASCGYHGSRQRTRKCEFPPPNYGGLPCVGKATETDVTCANKSCDKGLICLSCPSSVSPRTCNYVETCGPNSVCYLEQYVTHIGEIRFRSGCRDRLQCEDGIRRTKRFMVNGDYLSCAECCHGTLCNSHGCGEKGYPQLRGPICYNCDQQLDTEHCDKIDVCLDGQKCGLVRHQFVDTVYQTMCMDKKRCISDDSSNTDYPKCCSTTLCTFRNITNNNNIATPSKPTTTHGFTTAPSTKPTTTHGFTTAPSTKPTTTHGFTTAPSTKPTTTHGFTTAPSTKPTTTHGFTTAPATKPTTTHGFTTAPSTKPTSQIVGQWSEWGGWSPCLETKQGVTGTNERTRHCYNPNHTPPDTCIDGHTEEDRKYCSGGGTDACTPAKITDIIVKGSLELHGIVVLQCAVTGNPKPKTVWLTHTDSNDNTVQIYKGDPTQILVGPIEHRHEGNYVCEASNKCSYAVQKTFKFPPLS